MDRAAKAARWLQLGLCPRDGRAPAPGRKCCQPCLDHATRQNRRLRAENVADAKCIGCDAAVETNPRTGKPYTRCVTCRAEFNQLYPRSERKQRAREATE